MATWQTVQPQAANYNPYKKMPTTGIGAAGTNAGAAASNAATTPTQPTQPNLAPIKNPVMNASGTATNYTGTGGKTLNDILYMKKLYEGAGSNAGQQNWAAGNVGQFYNQLSPDMAAKVKGMNAQQLNDFIAGGGGAGLVNGGAGNGTGGTGTGTGTGSGVGTGYGSGNPYTTDLINQQRDLNAQNLQAQAYDARNQADAMNLQTAKGLQEIMANQGLGASGENITATLNQNAQRQGAITSINNQLSQNLNDLDISRAKQLQDQFNIDEDRALQLAQIMGNYRGQNTLAQNQFDFNKIESDRNYGLDKEKMNWGEYGDMVNWTQNLGLGPAENAKNLISNAYGGNQTAAGKNYDKEFKYRELRDLIGDQQWQQGYDQNERGMSNDDAYKWANFYADQEDRADNMAYKWAGLDAELVQSANQGQKYEGMTPNQVIDNIRVNLGDQDNKGKIPQENKIKAYLQTIGAGLPESQENQVLAQLGLTAEEIRDYDKQFLKNSSSLGKQ